MMVGDVVLIGDFQYTVDMVNKDGSLWLSPLAVSETPVLAAVPVDAVPAVSPGAVAPVDDVAQLLDYARALPDAADASPGHLGQLIAAVEYARAGKPIRLGAKSWNERVADLQNAVAVTKM